MQGSLGKPKLLTQVQGATMSYKHFGYERNIREGEPKASINSRLQHLRRARNLQVFSFSWVELSCCNLDNGCKRAGLLELLQRFPLEFQVGPASRSSF